jgi:hypothetical protein
MTRLLAISPRLHAADVERAKFDSERPTVTQYLDVDDARALHSGLQHSQRSPISIDD